MIKTSTYPQGDHDLVFKYGLSLEIDSRPQSNDSMIIAKSISSHKLCILANGEPSYQTTSHGDNS